MTSMKTFNLDNMRRLLIIILACLILVPAQKGWTQGTITYSSLQAPTSFTSEPRSASHFQLSWIDNSDEEEGFIIEKKRKGDPYWFEVGFVPANTSTFQSGGCLAETDYYHRVKAFKGQLFSDYSEVVEGKTHGHFKKVQGKVIESGQKRQGESSMIKISDNQLHIYYGSFEGVGDKDISKIARKASNDNGDTWGKQEVIFEEQGMSLLHPSVVRFTDEKIGIAYSKMVQGTWRAWKVFRYSNDQGKTWSSEIKVTDNSYAYSTGAHDHFTRLSNGMVVNLVHSVTRMPEENQKGKQLGTDIYATDDQGLTWNKLTEKPLNLEQRPYDTDEYGFYECSLVEWKNGNLVIFGRNGTGDLYAATSKDYGNNWTEPLRVGINNPLGPIKVDLIPGTNKIVLIHNPRTKPGENWGLGWRWIIVSRISNDGGITWTNYKELEYDGINHYSYPTLLMDGENVHLTYNKYTLDGDFKWQKAEIVYRKLPLNHFTKP